MTVTFDHDDLPFSPLYGDHYYSRNGGLAECNHVFLAGNGLPERWEGVDHFYISELGFGTGLNFLQTWAVWCACRDENQHLTFTSAEAHLMEQGAAAQALSRWPELEPYTSSLLSNWHELDSELAIDSQTSLKIVAGLADDSIVEFPVSHAWYLDGFAPTKNPEMWSENLLHAVGQRTAKSGTFASYTAAGWVRRNLESAGFHVRKEPGFGTKRHMISGTKL